MKIRKMISIVICVCLLFMLWVNPVCAASVIIISNESDLLEFCSSVNNGNTFSGQDVSLASDITLTGLWTPIGTQQNSFKGSFNGNGNTIRILTGNYSNTKYIGLFGCLDGTVNDLKIVVGTNGITANNDIGITYAGGIAGLNNGSINNCIVQGDFHGDTVASYSIVYADIGIGGICGQNKGTIDNCDYSGNISGINSYASAYCGGIAGDNKGTVKNCTSQGTISTSIRYSPKMQYAYSGGICGSNTGNVLNCENASAVSGNMTSGASFPAGVDVGGIVGYNAGVVENCQNSGDVSGTLGYPTVNIGTEVSVGGVAGYNIGIVTSSSNEGTMRAGENFSGGIVGWNYGGKISYCNSAGKVILASKSERIKYGGGIVGENFEGIVASCKTASELCIIESPSKSVIFGGLCGSNINGNIHNSCSVYTDNLPLYSGSLCGTNNGSIVCCYTLAQSVDFVVEQNGYVGNCYYLSKASGADGAKTSEQLKNPSTYNSWHLTEFWSFDTADGYPMPLQQANVSFEQGFGTVDSPYLISTEKELDKIRYTDNKYFRLTNDIVLTEKWLPIGCVKKYPFSGSIDGNGCTISDLDAICSNNAAGLIGYADGVEVCSLKIEAASGGMNYLDASEEKLYIGTIVGFGADTIINNCTASGSISVENTSVSAGGIVGELFNSITNCISDVDITIMNIVTENTNVLSGGIAGNVCGNVSQCESKGNITVNTGEGIPFAEVGGAFGSVSGIIQNVCAFGDVVVSTVADASINSICCGGLIGRSDGTVSNSYSSSELTAACTNGGAVGRHYNGSVNRVYYSDAEANNGIGVFCTIDDMKTDDFMSLVSAESQQPWVTDSKTGLPVPLHINASYDLHNGLPMLVLATNGQATIHYGSSAETVSSVYSSPIACGNNIKVYYRGINDNHVTEIFNITPYTGMSFAEVYDFGVLDYYYNIFYGGGAKDTVESYAVPINVGVRDGEQLMPDYATIKHSSVTKTKSDNTERRFYIHDNGYTKADEYLAANVDNAAEFVDEGTISNVVVAEQTQKWGFNGFQFANKIINHNPLNDGLAMATNWYNTMDLSGCLDTGYAVYNMQIPSAYIEELEEANPNDPLDGIYLAVGFGRAQHWDITGNGGFGRENFTGVPLKDYYDIERGGYQTIAVPLSSFDNRTGNYNCYAINNNMKLDARADLYFADKGTENSAKYFHGMGIIREDRNDSKVTGFAYDVKAMGIFNVYAPTSLVGAGTRSGVHLTWNKSVSHDVDGYRIYRDGELLDTVAVTEYTDVNAADGEHTYEVCAVVQHEKYDKIEFEGVTLNVTSCTELATFYFNGGKIEQPVCGDIAVEVQKVCGSDLVLIARKNDGALLEVRLVKFSGAMATEVLYGCNENDIISVYWWNESMKPFTYSYTLKKGVK